MISEYRKKVLSKIKENEKNRCFDAEVEDNPPSGVIKPNEVDYLNKKFSSKVMNFISNRLAINYYEKLIKKKQFIIEDVKGIENFLSVKGGAFITCNHFSVLDNYAIYRVLKKYLRRRTLYKVIREGNYTSFKGLYGMFFRHCNTLPLSSNLETMKKFMSSIKVLLSRGEKILIYPEQSMWWNYKKPRPMKSGAFNLAVKNKVPVIPAFITMSDSEYMDSDNYPVQKYVIWFLPPVYPKEQISDKENANIMNQEVYNSLTELYEKVYNLKLTYDENTL